MRLRSIGRFLSLIAMTGLVPVGLMARQAHEQTEMQKEGVQLVRLVEEVARDVRYHAERLNSFTSSMLISKWTHVHHLDQIKSLINDQLKPTLARLTEIQAHLPEWKQEAINKMLDTGKLLAADTSSAILTKNDAGAVPPALNKEYKDLITTINGHAEELVKVSDAAGTYAAARLKATEAGVKVPKH